MALLAESLVEEWLNRKGFFTIRGIKHGVAEMDLFAIRHEAGAIGTRERATLDAAERGSPRPNSRSRE
jgi:hypothetical protein